MGVTVLRASDRPPSRAAADFASPLRLLLSGVAPLLGLMLAGAILGLRASTEQLGWETVNVELVGNPPAGVLAPTVLLATRLARLATVVGVLLFGILLDEQGFVMEPEGPKGPKVHVNGAGRFSTFTVWCWSLQGCYFLLASYCSLLHISPSLGGPQEDSFLPVAVAWVLYEVCASTSVLVTVVTTFVLFPEAERMAAKSKGGTELEMLRRWPALMSEQSNGSACRAGASSDGRPLLRPVHNANIAFMVAELLLTGMPLHLPHLAFAVILGCTCESPPCPLPPFSEQRVLARTDAVCAVC